MTTGPSLAPFAIIHTLDQWRRASYENIALEERDDEFGLVQLAWITDDTTLENSATTAHEELNPSELSSPMAFDPWCRFYRVRSEEGQIDKILNLNESQEVVPLFESRSVEAGDFYFDNNSIDTGPLSAPIDIVVDNNGRLFIAERDKQRVVVFDLKENRLLRYLYFKETPLKLATNGEKVYLLFSDASVYATFDARTDAKLYSLPDHIVSADDIVVGHDIYILSQAGTSQATIYALNSGDQLSEPYVQHMALTQEHILVLARLGSDDFLRYQIDQDSLSELPHLKARHYKGSAIVVTPEGDIGYWSDKGFLRATLARVRYETQGTVTSFQLDSGEFQTQWGRLFIDACLPRGTKVTARCLVLDEIPETAKATISSLPSNSVGVTINRPDLSPPLPPEILMDSQTEEQLFYRREHGTEIPWEGCDDDNHFRTYEAPIIAPPGRYLWVVLELSGTSRKTPRIKSLRAEYNDHDLLRRLPQVFSRDDGEADFLRRYLAMPEGLMRDLDLKATFRHILLDPYATPSDLLPWLGSFMGLVVDQRWSERAKRELVANCTWLFRYRGTVGGLRRFIEIYLGCQVTIIEHFKARGLGGAFIGNASEDAQASSAILGAGFRIGGRIGQEETTSVNEISIEDAVKAHAHRFSLIIAASLDTEQQEVIEHLLDTHRPAHTLYDVCTVDAGMRIGRGLHAGLTSIIGHTSGFGELQIGGSILGHTDTLGQANMGTTIGGSYLGEDSRVG